MWKCHRVTYSIHRPRNTVHILYKYNTQILYKTTIEIHVKNTIEIQQKNVTVSHIPLRGGAPGGPEEAAFIAGSGEAPEYLVSF